MVFSTETDNLGIVFGIHGSFVEQLNPVFDLVRKFRNLFEHDNLQLTAVSFNITNKTHFDHYVNIHSTFLVTTTTKIFLKFSLSHSHTQWIIHLWLGNCTAEGTNDFKCPLLFHSHIAQCLPELNKFSCWYMFWYRLNTRRRFDIFLITEQNHL